MGLKYSTAVLQFDSKLFCVDAVVIALFLTKLFNELLSKKVPDGRKMLSFSPVYYGKGNPTHEDSCWPTSVIRHVIKIPGKKSKTSGNELFSWT